VREAHEGFYANVPTPNHHYSFCEGAALTSDVGVLSGAQTDVAIRDHITGDPAHDLEWNGKFEKFRDAPAEGAAFVGAAGECCEPMYRQFGFSTRAARRDVPRDRGRGERRERGRGAQVPRVMRRASRKM
jgi:hypothetical protein